MLSRLISTMEKISLVGDLSSIITDRVLNLRYGPLSEGLINTQASEELDGCTLLSHHYVLISSMVFIGVHCCTESVIRLVLHLK
jgi:hypothetical protein